jgi:uncharacterized membrane protein/mono/diheme cytochrome c family protein
VITDLLSFIGRFHPLLVHLPIGALFVAIVFGLMQVRTHRPELTVPLSITLWIGAVSAVFASITGYFLSQTADYEQDVVQWHQWLGIATAVVSCSWLVLHYRSVRRTTFIMATMVLVLLVVTGHLGGTLTHGEDYLTLNQSDDDTVAMITRKPLADLQEAVIYTDIVQPVIEARCYSCHGANKQKGKLRLDEPGLILRGGKNGDVLTASGGEEPELLRRLLLPLNDKKHMPPKNKTQLTTSETALIHWWVSSGASFEQKVKNVTTPDKIKTLLQELQNPVSDTGPGEKPLNPVNAADPKAIQALRERGVVILPVSAGNNYLNVNFVSVDNASDADIRLLSSLKEQIISLKLADTKITDSALKIIGSFPNLRSLYLERTLISDSGLADLVALNELHHLNLVGTRVTINGLLLLKKLPVLKSVYLYQTNVSTSDWTKLQAAFPKTRLDSGGYTVPILHSDTSMIAPKKK